MTSVKNRIAQYKYLLAFLIPLLSSQAVYADENTTHVNLNVNLTSDYVFRGLSQTDGDPALQADLTVVFPVNVYAGVFLSNVEKPWGAVYNQVGGEEDFEYDLYLGYRFSGSSESEISGDVGIIRYSFEPDPDELTWTEIYLGVSGYGASAKFSQRVAGADQGSYVEARYNGSAAKLFDYSIHAGHFFLDIDIRDTDAYSDFSLGVSKSFKGLKFDLTYFVNDKDGEARYLEVADDRFVVSLSKNFTLK